MRANNYTMTNISERGGYKVKYNFTFDPLMRAEQKWYQNAESVFSKLPQRKNPINGYERFIAISKQLKQIKSHTLYVILTQRS